MNQQSGATILQRDIFTMLLGTMAVCKGQRNAIERMPQHRDAGIMDSG